MTAEEKIGKEETKEQVFEEFKEDDIPENTEKTDKSAKAEKKEEKKASKELESVKAELEKAKKDLAELNDRYLRTGAEYDNFRKRSRAEKESVYSDAYADALKALLPIIDNLELAGKYSEGEEVVKGMRMIASQLPGVLEKMGITEIETKTFDPNLHNAVMHVEDESLGEGEITDVFQKGYKRGDHVIRHAMVKVAN